MFREIFNTFFPQVCPICEQVLSANEQIVCTECLHRLPVVEKPEVGEELIKTHFYGRLQVAHAAGLLYYRKGGQVQRLIHQLKYFEREEIGPFLGRWLADYLKDTSWSKSVDMIVPVPLHKNKRRQRGYNQVEGFGRTLAHHLSCDYSDAVLIKTSDNSAQVFKNRLARSALKNAYFTLQHKAALKNKHVLLVDDIITTGATLETCAQNLLKGNPSKISLATMAITTI